VASKSLKYRSMSRSMVGPVAVVGLALATCAMPAQAATFVDDSVMARASGDIFKYFHPRESIWVWEPFVGDFAYGSYWNTWYRAYCQFDISSVPDTASVDSATLSFRQYCDWGLDYVRLYWLELQSPDQMTPRQLCSTSTPARLRPPNPCPLPTAG